MTQPSRVWSDHIRDMLSVVPRTQGNQLDTLYAIHALCRVMENIQATLEQIDARLARLEVRAE